MGEIDCVPTGRSDLPFNPADRVNPVPTSKKTPSIREVEEVREVRDDRPPCFLVQLSQDKESGSGATPTTRRVR